MKAIGFGLFLILFCASVNAAAPPISEKDRTLLERIQKDSLQYFIRMSDKTTGLTRDSSRSGSPASIAATGFSLASIAIAGSKNWIPPDYARAQIQKTLRALLSKANHENGFFYHFLDTRTGRRVWSSEASSIDTALLLAGALLASRYYPGTDIERMANDLYERVDWKWMMNGSDFVCMGWTPESGFLPYYWDSYNELLILLALGLGASSNPLPAEAWESWFRREGSYNNRTFVYSSSGSLFTYQYSHAFIDFNQISDNGINYFENSKQATLANKEYSDSFRSSIPSYRNVWGLSASVGPGGYKAYGGKPGEGIQDGTIAPYAAISSIIFTPGESMAAIQSMYSLYNAQLYGPFGFRDAFNVEKNFWASEYLGIDQGIIVLMLENYLNDGILWKKFMPLPAIQNWIKKCDLAPKPLAQEPLS